MTPASDHDPVSGGVIALRVVALLLLVTLAGGCVWAQGAEGLASALVRMGRDPWGAVTFVDLGSGLLMMALWISWREPRRGLVPLWWLALGLLGNMGTLLFVLRCTWGSRTLSEVITGPATATAVVTSA